MTEAPVAVIGGGITGMGVARDLAMRDIPVTVLERGRPGAGATGSSHGLLHSGARYADVDPGAARDCARERDVVARIAGACVRDTGGLVVSLDCDDAEYFEEKLDACRARGIDADVLPAETAREREPSLSEATERVIAVRDGVVSPSRLLAATAESATRHGAELRRGTRVTGLTVHDGAVRTVRIRSRDGPEAIDVAHVVNAAGPWAGRVAGLAGIRLGMRPTRGTMVAVAHGGIRHVLNRCRPPDDGDIVVPRGSEAVLGTTSVPVDGPTGTTPTGRESDRVVSETAAMVPALLDAPATRVFAGIRPLLDGGDRSGSRGFRVLDHGSRDGVTGFTTVAGGKLTTYRAMGEAVGDRVGGALGIDAPSRTADAALPHVDDPAALDRLVERYGAGGPADVDR